MDDRMDERIPNSSIGESDSRRRTRPLPLWSKGGIALGVTLALLLAFLMRTLTQRGDWAEGMQAVALSAGLLAALALLLGVVRAMAGRRARHTLLQTALLILLLLAIAAESFLVAPLLHTLQAQNALRQGRWAEAIAELAFIGERAPNAPQIAGAYVAWGEQLLAQQDYAGAAAKFVVVTGAYAGSGPTVLARAQSDLYRAYLGWMRGDAHAVSYGGESGALATFQQYSANPACDAACQGQLPTLIAQAHYAYGQQLVATRHYAEAIPQFEAVTRLYASSAYAHPAHRAAAQAYLALGQQQIAAQACSGAVASYQTLVARYGDTAESGQARTALAAPQPVSGTLSGLPTNPTPRVALSTHVDVTGFVFSADFTATPNASGAFSFPQVAQGDYNLSTRRDLNNSFSYTYYHDTKGNVYTVHVGPLCPVRLGTIAFTS